MELLLLYHTKKGEIAQRNARQSKTLVIGLYAATDKPHRGACVGLSMTFSIWPTGSFLFVF